MGENQHEVARRTAVRPARVLLVDDHEVVRSGLRQLIELDNELVVVGEAGTAEESVRLTRVQRPDVVVMDVRLPDGSGISACHQITRDFPDVKVLILTSYADEIALAASITAGASGYLLKSVRGTDLVDVLKRVIAGETVFEQEERIPREPRLLDCLSPQERSLAGHLARGLTNREIAARMGLAEKTVKNYVSSVLTKLGLARRSEAAAFVARIEATAGPAVLSLDHEH